MLGSLIAFPPTSFACELPAKPATDHHLMFVLDPGESLIQFEADARLHTFTGTAGKLSGLVRLASVSPLSGAEACVEIAAASLATGIELRDERMRSSHLHTDRFPTILFTLTGVDQVEPLRSDRYTITLRGTLMIHGVTSAIAAPATAHLSPTRLEVEGKVPVRLSTFHIPIPSFLFISLKEEVVVSFKVKAVRK